MLGLAAPLALLVLVAFVVIAPSVSILAHGGYLVIAVCAAILVAHTATGPVTPLLKALAIPLVVYVGRLSYSLYLWHFPVFHALTADALGLPRPVTIVIRLAVTVALAAASYHLVENRFRARARPPLQPGVPVPA
jgi:peptidoglycan/LPS O-acetylase OafA/YrhL